MTQKTKFNLKIKPFPVFNGRLQQLRFSPVEPPFPKDTKVVLTTGESGTIYEDGWGNSSYLQDDGIVYVYFLPDNTKDLDDVKNLPLSYFGDFEINVDNKNILKPKDNFNDFKPSAYISINNVSGEETLARDKVTSNYDRTLYSHKALYEVNKDFLKEIDDLKSSLDWYKNRVEKLQKVQNKMRDPERIMVCDILANGMLLEDNDRYKIKEPIVDVAKMVESNGRTTYFVYLKVNNEQSIIDAFQLFSSQSENEANYYKDDLKYHLGLGDEPDILNYMDK